MASKGLNSIRMGRVGESELVESKLCDERCGPECGAWEIFYLAFRDPGLNIQERIFLSMPENVKLVNTLCQQLAAGMGCAADSNGTKVPLT